MNTKPFILSCNDEHWQLKLEVHLNGGFSVDLIDFDFDRDGKFCQILAQRYDMVFTIDRNPTTRVGHFMAKA